MQSHFLSAPTPSYVTLPLLNLLCCVREAFRAMKNEVVRKGVFDYWYCKTNVLLPHSRRAKSPYLRAGRGEHTRVKRVEFST